MPRSGIGMTELLNVLHKVGAPMQNSQAMQQAGVNLPGQVQNQIYAQDKILPQIRKNHRAQLDSIANLDKQLYATYGDPNSELYIENPVSRQRAISGAEQQGYSAANTIKGAAKGQESELDKQVSDVLSYYNKLEVFQKKEETRLTKMKKQGTADAKKKATAQKKQIDQYLKDTGRNITDKAKITEQKARDLFLSKPTAFQKLWIRHVLEGTQKMPKGGFTTKDVDANFKQWEKTYKPPTAKKKTATAQQERLDALKKAFEKGK